MASNTPSLNRLIEIIGLVSRNHRMVRDFRFGTLWDMNALKDLQTPYIWCEEAQSRITIGNGSHKTGLYTFRLYCMDRIQKDQSNYNEILSDTKFILDTIVTELDQHPLFIELGLSIDQGDIVFEPVYEETDSNCNGHSVEFTLRFPIRYTPCNVPIDALAGFTYSLNNNVFQYSVVGVPGPTGPQGETGPQGFQGFTGPQGPQGFRGFQGAGGLSSAYGIFYDTTIQTNATTFNKMQFNSTEGSNLIAISDGSEINISLSGTYNIQFSAQVEKTDGGSDDIEIWLTKNGNIEDWSNTRITLPGNNSKVVAAWNWMVNANSGDYYEIVWYSDDANIRLYAESSPPAQVAIPSVILTVQLLTFQGPQGNQGLRGFQGFQGFQGFTGPQGFQGFTGPQGNTGFQGSTGPQGDMGFAGPQGDQGPQGDVGATGSSGISGGQLFYFNINETGGPDNDPLISKNISTDTSSYVQGSAAAGATDRLWFETNYLTETFIPPGIWDFNLFLLTTEDFTINIEVYSVDGSGQTLIATSDTINTGINNSSAVPFNLSAVIPSVIFFNGQGAIRIKFIFTNNGTFGTEFIRFYSYATNYAHFHSTIGIVGNQGATGSQGSTGAQGATGPQGFDGPQGPQGYQPVFSIGSISSLFYNGGDLIDPIFSTVNQSFSDGDGLYLNKGQLILMEDIALAPFGNKIIINADTITDDRTWTFPDTTDTFVGRNSFQIIGAKVFTSVAFYPNGVTSSKGDLFFTPTNGGYISRLGIGPTGSILGATNGIPTWINPGSASSVLTLVNGLPTWRNLNFQTQTDGTAITNTTANTWTGGVFIPANSVQVGDSILIRTRVRKTGVAGTVIVRMYIGTGANISGTLIATSPTNAATTLFAQVTRSLSVKSSTNTESFPTAIAVLLDDAQVTTTAAASNNIDWTVGQWINVGVQNSALGDTSRTSFIQVEIIR